MMPVDWNELIRHINRSMPGVCLWMQCVPVWDDDSPTEEGVGLTIQRLLDPGGGRHYQVIYFSVVPDPEATDEHGLFLPDRGDRTSDWTIESGYDGDFDTLEGAIAEAKSLARNLPMSGIFRTHERREAILDKVTDPDEDLEQSA